MGDSKAIELSSTRVTRLAMAHRRLAVDSTNPLESNPPSESPLETMLQTWFSRFSEMKILPQHVVDNVRSCPHIHQLLFTVINRKGNLPPLTGFHHWGTGSDRKSRIVPSNRGPNDLRYIYGFQELGTVWIPESNASSLDDVHRYLGSFVPQQQETSESEITESIVEALRIGEGGVLSSPAIPIQLFTILVYGNAKDELFTGDDIPEWIWMKPHSTYYFLGGHGSDDIDKSIDNEQVQPTKEVHILVRGLKRQVRRRRLI